MLTYLIAYEYSMNIIINSQILIRKAQYPEAIRQ